jgi:cytochrome P450
VSVSEPAAAPPGSGNGGGLPEASVAESARVVAAGLLPGLVRGLFSPRPAAMKRLTAVDADRRTIEVLSDIRRRHGGQGVRLFGGRLVVVWGPEAIREVLDQSADVYASDSGAKGKGMAHFQPDALTVSRGEAWRDRRAFNESVLATSERVHPLADRLLAVVAEEVDRMRVGASLEWGSWESLFDHITLRVIFGDGARDDHELTELLERLMGEANRLVGLSHSDDYYEFYGGLERRLIDPEPGSLLSRFSEAPQTDLTRVVHQIPHWMFATRDTLAANTYRALGVIVGDPAVERRVREELEGVDLGDAGAVDGLRLLEGYLHEVMRLWPTVPLLARETTRETTLAGQRLDEGTQVMILNTFNHRDPDQVPDADRLQPERWAQDQHDYRFNHLSNGTQDCPGGPLVLLLGKAALGRVLERYRLSLDQPRLEPGGDLPHMLNFFEMRFGASRADGRPS